MAATYEECLEIIDNTFAEYEERQISKLLLPSKDTTDGEIRELRGKGMACREIRSLLRSHLGSN